MTPNLPSLDRMTVDHEELPDCLMFDTMLTRTLSRTFSLEPRMPRQNGDESYMKTCKGRVRAGRVDVCNETVAPSPFSHEDRDTFPI